MLPDISTEPISYFEWLIEAAGNVSSKIGMSKLMTNISCKEHIVKLDRPIGQDEVVVEFVMQAVTDAYNLPSRKVMMVKTRFRESCEPRQLGMYLMKKYSKLSYKEIGQLFVTGGDSPYDHATVINACKHIQGLLDSENKDFIEKFNHAASIFESLSGISVPLID